MMHFTIDDKEASKKVKDMLSSSGINFNYKKKDQEGNLLKEVDYVIEKNKEEAEPAKVAVPEEEPQKSESIEIPKKKKRGRKRLTKEEREARKKNRTKEEQEKINKRMALLRERKKAKKANKKK